VCASCDNARLNAVSADIVHKRDKRSQSKHEERYRKEYLTLGVWFASGDIGGLFVCGREDREGERERKQRSTGVTRPLEPAFASKRLSSKILLQETVLKELFL
jgi:hypothetical protein